MRFCLIIFLMVIGFGGAADGQEPGNCPSLTVIGPSKITTPGDIAEFAVETDANVKELHFYWTVSDGIIEEGQGTTTIKVRTSREDEGETIEAKVSVSGFPKGCRSAAIETAPLDHIITGCGPDDEFGDLEPNDVRARTDGYMLQLMNNPTNKGVVILQITDGDELSETNSRLQLIVQHLVFREFDLDRITFMLEKGDVRYTKLYRVPPGGEEPPCNECIEVHPIPLQ